jgi:hypothetical protein
MDEAARPRVSKWSSNFVLTRLSTELVVLAFRFRFTSRTRTSKWMAAACVQRFDRDWMRLVWFERRVCSVASGEYSCGTEFFGLPLNLIWTWAEAGRKNGCNQSAVGSSASDERASRLPLALSLLQRWQAGTKFQGQTLIVLFGGGTKRRQQEGIDRAKDLHAEYKSRKAAAKKARDINSPGTKK